MIRYTATPKGAKISADIAPPSTPEAIRAAATQGILAVNGKIAGLAGQLESLAGTVAGFGELIDAQAAEIAALKAAVAAHGIKL